MKKLKISILFYSFFSYNKETVGEVHEKETITTTINLNNIGVY